MYSYGVRVIGDSAGRRQDIDEAWDTDMNANARSTLATLEPFYYLKNFQLVLSTILARYADLLAADELRFIAEFPRAPQRSRALLARMVMRRGDLFRASKLNYLEIGDTRVAAAPLIEAGWLTDRPMLYLEQLQSVLTKAELIRSLALPRRYADWRKPDLVAMLKLQLPEPREFVNWCPGVADCVYTLLVAPIYELGWKEIKEFIDSAGVGLRADRERAMLCVAYETLARRGELVALLVQDIDFHPDGTGIALIRRGKTDAEGQGRSAYLSRETVKWLKIWLDHAGIDEGALFRRLIGQNQIGGPLNPGSIAPIFKRVAQWIGLPERYLKLISGHSTRVGATQDLAALDIDLAAITQAGGWKSTRMPLQYAERINVARSGMAKAAEKAGRDSIGK